MIYKNEVDLILKENNFKIENFNGSGNRIVIHLLSGRGRSLPHGPRMKIILGGSTTGYFEIRQHTGEVVYDKKYSDLSASELSNILPVIEDISYGCYRAITAYFYFGSYKSDLEEALQRIGSANRSERKRLAKEYRERFSNISYEK